MGKYKCTDGFLKSKISHLENERHVQFHEELVAKLDLSKGDTVLDLGCGCGSSFRSLLKSIGDKGKLTGLEIDESQLAVAEYAFQRELDSSVLTLVKATSDDARLPFDDNSFDAILCQNVLECVGDKVAYLNECFRVLKAGGKLLMSHKDFDTATYYSEKYKDFTRTMVHIFADTKADWMPHSDGQMGRKLRGLFRESSFKSYDAYTMIEQEEFYGNGMYGYEMSQWMGELVDSQDFEGWSNEMSELSNLGKYHYSVQWMYVLAVK